jgi:cytochrome c nitrite reductase small subunit
MSLLKWTGAASLIIGVALGIGAYTFVYAEGPSYASDDAAACANCHVMKDHHAAWMKSSHAGAATCNDCHTRPGTVSKYVSKAGSGLRHSVAFTSGGFPDRLRISGVGARVTEEACRNCHEQIVTAMVSGYGGGEGERGDGILCVRCHADVGHWVR